MHPFPMKLCALIVALLGASSAAATNNIISNADYQAYPTSGNEWLYARASPTERRPHPVRGRAASAIARDGRAALGAARRSSSRRAPHARSPIPSFRVSSSPRRFLNVKALVGSIPTELGALTTSTVLKFLCAAQLSLGSTPRLLPARPPPPPASLLSPIISRVSHARRGIRQPLR